MSDTKKHEGSCHCGNVRFEVDGDMNEAMTCNCSICQRTGTMLAFVPDANFHLVQGDDALADYQFGKKSIHHRFCKTCGVRAFGDGTGPDGVHMYAINVRCLHGVDLDDVKVTKFDGRSL